MCDARINEPLECVLKRAKINHAHPSKALHDVNYRTLSHAPRKGKPGKERAKSKYTQQLQFPLQQLDKNFAKKTICMETLGRTKLKQTRNKNFPDSQTRRVEIRSACACAWPDKSFN